MHCNCTGMGKLSNVSQCPLCKKGPSFHESRSLESVCTDRGCALNIKQALAHILPWSSAVSFNPTDRAACCSGNFLYFNDGGPWFEFKFGYRKS